MKKLLCLCLLAVPMLLLSQMGTLDLRVSPDTVFVRIDGQVEQVVGRANITLPAGTYRIELWAPLFALHTDTVRIERGRTTRLDKGLVDKSDNYAPYLAARRDFATRKLKRTIADGTFVAAWSALGYILLGRNIGETSKLYDRALDLREAHRFGVGAEGIAQSRIDYTRVSAEYEDSKESRDQRLTIGIPTMTVATAALVYHLLRRSKNRPERPVYSPKNPFVDTAEPDLSFSGSLNGVGLTLTF